ncbi:hypothetical protein Tco_0800537 [Tanacetum coccineum]|uniref:Uncharacterized protein n=1 Tax=Tanacetum coccineum TaxID=301880 RepID=A0ABQ4ZTE1_9ASTR
MNGLSFDLTEILLLIDIESVQNSSYNCDSTVIPLLTQNLPESIFSIVPMSLASSIMVLVVDVFWYTLTCSQRWFSSGSADMDTEREWRSQCFAMVLFADVGE